MTLIRALPGMRSGFIRGEARVVARCDRRVLRRAGTALVMAGLDPAIVRGTVPAGTAGTRSHRTKDDRADHLAQY